MPHPKRKGYPDKLVNFKIPASLGEQIDEFVKKHPGPGFRNRTEFILYVLRRETEESKKEVPEEAKEE